MHLVDTPSYARARLDAARVQDMNAQKYRHVVVAIGVRHLPELFPGFGAAVHHAVGDRQVIQGTGMRSIHYAILHGLPTSSIDAKVWGFEGANRAPHQFFDITSHAPQLRQTAVIKRHA